jgi:hypothetical protein
VLVVLSFLILKKGKDKVYVPIGWFWLSSEDGGDGVDKGDPFQVPVKVCNGALTLLKDL